MKVVVLGGASSGTMVAEVAVISGHEVIGLLNDQVPRGARINGLEVLGAFEDWTTLARDCAFVAACPYPGRAEAILGRLASLGIPDDRWCSVVHPSASISAHALVEPGAFVAQHVVIEHGATVGRHGILRAGAYVSHDVTLEEFVFVGSHASILGRSRVRTGGHVGANSVLREGSDIGTFAMVGVGSVVVRPVGDHETVGGNPARRLGR